MHANVLICKVVRICLMFVSLVFTTICDVIDFLAIWKRLFSCKSSNEKGTLYQLKNVINRKSVPLDPQTNMNAAEDFLLLVLHAHIVAAGETISSYVSVISVSDLARRILNNYICIPPSSWC